MARAGALLAAALALALAQRCSAFYLPGVAPQDYEHGDVVGLKVNKLSSTKTQLPYEYYSLPYCQPETIVNSAENLGEVLRGDRIENSLYQVSIGQDEQCKLLCKLTLNDKSAGEFEAKVKDDYRVNMILDNLPVAMVKMREDNGKPIKTYERGFPVGFMASSGQKGDKAQAYLHNHVRLTILIHKDIETEMSRIVGFEVEPFSAAHKQGKSGELSTCNPEKMVYVSHEGEPQLVASGKEVIFTYDVLFRLSDIKWASRWDTYLLMTDDQIHWFSIINSLMIVLFLSGMVAMIMLRTLHRDISKYNQLETVEEAQEETGWKLVHGDVFRPPAAPGMLSVLCGCGVQLTGMGVVTVLFAVLGFLSPANRGGLMTAMLLLFVFMGLFAGYTSARLFKQFKGTEWKTNTLKTAFLLPGAVFAIFVCMNTLIWGQKSSGAVPFGTLFALLFLWFGISVPLVFVGSYFGFKAPAAEDPVRTKMIPRLIPEQAWYMHPAFSILIGGVLPFGAVFIELFFILTSIWLHQFFYAFGFIMIVGMILVLTCAEIAIVLCYFQLCAEDYNWWWRSFLTSGSSAGYMFAYSVFYFFTKLEITKFVSGLLYFGYMSIAALVFFVSTGTIGFYACYWFVWKIFSAIKVD